MKIRWFYILFFLPLLSEIACQNSGNLRLPEHESKLVVHAHWEFDESMWVHVSHSYSTGELVTPNDLILSDARVEVWENGIKLPDFEYHDTLLVVPPQNNYEDTSLVLYGQYMHPTYGHVKAEAHYQLKVSHPDFDDVIAEFQVPKKAEMTAASIEFFAVTEIDLVNAAAHYHVIEATITDPPEEDNYYYLELVRTYIDTINPDTVRYYSGIMEVLETFSSNTLVPAGTAIFTDEGRNGQQFVETFYVPWFSFFSVSQGRPHKGNYYFRLYTMTKSMADYYEGTIKQRRELNLDNFLFSAGATPISSNIEGGYGVFGHEQFTSFKKEF